MNEEVSFAFPPRRIISLVPSQTELLYTLGLDAEVVGITKFCVHPSEWTKSKTLIGGTKAFLFDVIESLNPDLIIGNKEENYREGIELLKHKFPVWMSDIYCLADALKMIENVGEITGKSEEALSLVSSIQNNFDGLVRQIPRRALYLIWRKPWMAAGKNTFIDDMLTRNGLTNVTNESRYPQLSSGDIASLAPEVILLSSEPYPFKEKHLQEMKELCPSAKIMLVDGEMFSWYGSRLVKSCDYFRTLSF